MSGDPDTTDPLSDLGFGRPAAPALDAAALATLDAVRAQISQEIEVQQGGWRQLGPIGRYWPFAVALVVGVIVASIMPVGVLNPVLLVSIIAAALSAAICFASVALAPTQPRLSERLAMGGIATAAIAFAAQLAGGWMLDNTTFHLDQTLGCTSNYTLLVVAPLVILIYGLRRSGFPVRALHAFALGTSALAIAAAGIWRACTPADTMHIALGHVAIPLLALPIIGLLAWRLARPKSAIL